VVVTDSSNYHRLYVDNNQYPSKLLNNVDLKNITIGKRSDNVWFFKGKIDDICIYNRALNPSEVKSDTSIITTGTISNNNSSKTTTQTQVSTLQNLKKQEIASNYSDYDLEFVEKSYVMYDVNNNGMVDPLEKCSIKFKIRNASDNDVPNNNIGIKCQDVFTGLEYDWVVEVGTVKAGDTASVEFSVKGLQTLTTSVATFLLSIKENGTSFGEHVNLAIKTQPISNVAHTITAYWSKKKGADWSSASYVVGDYFIYVDGVQMYLKSSSVASLIANQYATLYANFKNFVKTNSGYDSEIDADYITYDADCVYEDNYDGEYVNSTDKVSLTFNDYKKTDDHSVKIYLKTRGDSYLIKY